MQIETTQLKIQHSTRIIYIKGSVSLFYTRPGDGGGGGGGGGRSSRSSQSYNHLGGCSICRHVIAGK